MTSDVPVVRWPLFVGARHLAVWSVRSPNRYREWLDAFEPGYFEYLADVHARHLRGKHAQQSALALRVGYGMGLEALFALLGASIQAPWCVQAWLGLYKVAELQALVRSVMGVGEPFPHIVQGELSWQSVSRHIHREIIARDPRRGTTFVNKFAGFWANAAADFTDSKFSGEFNASKHGLRLRPGGFTVALGPPKPAGSPPTCPSEMQSLGGSTFGATTWELAKLDDSNTDRVFVRRSRNWSPRRYVDRLHLIAMSVRNIVAHLKVLNLEPRSVRFELPSSRLIRRAWQPTPGVETLDWPDPVPEHYEKVSRSAVEAAYDAYRRQRAE